MKLPWQNPILVRPTLAIARRDDPVRIPIDQRIPRELLERHRIGAPFEDGFGAYVAENELEWVVCAGPLDYQYERPALHEQAEELAPFLPDLHLVSHDEEGVRWTLTNGVITEIIIREGEAQITDLPIRDAIPRARYLDTRQGAQGFATELELLLSLIERQVAPSQLVQHCRDELYLHSQQIGTQATGQISDIWNTDPVLQMLAVLETHGVGHAGAVAALRRVEAVASAALLQWLRTTRAPHPETAQRLTELASIVGPSSQLAALLGTLGPGQISEECRLWSAEQIIRTANTGAADWPQELCQIGECAGQPMCIDLRYRPAPVVVALDDEQLRFVEMDTSLYSMLAFGAPA